MGLAVPLGLIVNELITNCYKYAFAHTDIGNHIRLNFKQVEGSSQFKLLIRDNGKGLPPNFDMKELSSFGMQLVQGLVEQLHGRIEVIQEKGAAFQIYLEEPIAA